MGKWALNYLQRNNKGLITCIDSVKTNEKKTPGASKTKPIGFGSMAQLQRSLVNKMFKKYLRKSSAKVWDMIVSHSACPQVCESMVEQLKAKVRRKGGGAQIRNVYYAEMTTVVGVHVGPGAFSITMWPADDMDFANPDARIVAEPGEPGDGPGPRAGRRQT